jgi:hypothetical protein
MHSFRTEGPDTEGIEQDLVLGALRYLLDRFGK